jgi:phosphoenolpyruvate synthase/pyruvate phosphate dikinase
MDGDSDLLVWLDDDRHGCSRIGGKGAGLGRLAGLGAPVPPAFCLTTDAYRAMAHALGFPATLGNVGDAQLTAIRVAIEEAPLAATVREGMHAGFRSLAALSPEPLAVAVRSSAPTEDGAAFSHAGLHDTVLDVRDPSVLEAAIKRCWASLWTERAVAYRRRNGADAGDAAIAVVVQQMVRCDVSVVVFTADPVSGDGDRLVIDATWGLGEALVSSLVTPDRIAVDASGRVAAYAVGTKETMVVPDPDGAGGTRRVPVPQRLRTTPVLTEEQAVAIATEARSLARRLGCPIDLEGGLLGETFFVFQARPITTFTTAAAGFTGHGHRRCRFGFGTEEN